MRKQLFFGLLAAFLIPAVPALADHDHDDHHDRGEHRGWDEHHKEWHHHHHVARENYYMEYPAEPVIIQRPRPVIVAPAQMVPVYQSGPSLNISIH